MGKVSDDIRGGPAGGCTDENDADKKKGRELEKGCDGKGGKGHNRELEQNTKQEKRAGRSEGGKL